MTGQHIDIKKYCRVVFVLYVEVHDDPNITNNTSPRTYEYIALGPTVNIKGTQEVFFLNSGRVMKRINITPMIATYHIIKIVE